MSDTLNIKTGNVDNNSSYTIKTIQKCRIVIGDVPLRDISMLTSGFSDQAIMDIDIANIIGATFVIGEPDDIFLLRQSDLPVSDSRRMDAERARANGYSQGLINWLLTGERGLSSNAMCSAFFGIPKSAHNNHPLDPDDLRRCFQFVDSFDEPTQPLLKKLVSLSEEWKAISESWELLYSCFHNENNNSDTSSMPITYGLLKDIINSSHKEP